MDKGIKHFVGKSTKECEDVAKNLTKFEEKAETIAADEKVTLALSGQKKKEELNAPESLSMNK